MLTSAYQLFRERVPDPEWAPVVPHFRRVCAWQCKSQLAGWGCKGFLSFRAAKVLPRHSRHSTRPLASALPAHTAHPARRHLSERELAQYDVEGTHAHGWFYTTVIT